MCVYFKTLECSHNGFIDCCRGNAAILFIIYKDCFMGTCICGQCAINSIRSSVGARRRCMYTP